MMDNCRIFRADAFRFIKSCKQQYDFIFADPPYALKELPQIPDLVLGTSTRLSPLTSLLIRQIVRDHGEATARRGCGIVIDNNLVNITLPRHNGKI